MVESREGVGRREEKTGETLRQTYRWTEGQVDGGTERWTDMYGMDRKQGSMKGGGRERGRKGRREKSRDSLIREMNESRSLIMVHCAKKVLSGSP